MAGMEHTPKHRRRLFADARITLRRMPWHFWAVVVGLVTLWTLYPILSGDPWTATTLPSMAAVVAIVLLRWDPPPTLYPFRRFVAYLLPRAGVPALCSGFLFEYNLNWIEELILNSIVIVWLGGVAFRGRRKQRERAARQLAELRKSGPPWNAFAFPLDAAPASDMFAPLTGYERGIIARYSGDPEAN